MLQKLVAVLFALIVFNLFFFGVSFPFLGSISFFCVILSIHVFLLIAFFNPVMTRRYWLAVASMGLSLLAVGLSLFRASEVDQFFLSGLSLGLSVIATYLLALQHDHFGAVSEIALLPLRLTWQWLEQAARVFSSVPEWIISSSRFLDRLVPHSLRSSKNWSAVMRGLIITLPIVLVVVGLLSGADPIFSHFLKELLTFNLPNLVISLPARLIASILVFILVTPLAFLTLRERFQSPLLNKELGKYSLESLILVGSLALVLGLFIVIQSKYLFTTVPEVELHQFGVNTYSEYVRKGFSELLLVSIITYLVAGASMVVFRVAQGNKELLRNFNVVLLGEMLLFIFSIFRRVALYQVEHGLTRIRIYGSLFLVMLIGLTIILLLRQLIKGFRWWYAYEVGLVTAIIFFAGVLNIDNLIATRFQPTVNNETDYVYISRLSPDAVLGWVEVVNHAEEVANKFFGTNEVLTDADAREITYAYYAIRNVKHEYYKLVHQYGDKEELAMIGVATGSGEVRDRNLGEMVAYDTLKGLLTYSEIHLLDIQLTELYTRLNQSQQSRQYDRSLDSPLVE